MVVSVTAQLGRRVVRRQEVLLLPLTPPLLLLALALPVGKQEKWERMLQLQLPGVTVALLCVI
jgi:hypothetical protein